MHVTVILFLWIGCIFYSGAWRLTMRLFSGWFGNAKTESDAIEDIESGIAVSEKSSENKPTQEEIRPPEVMDKSCKWEKSRSHLSVIEDDGNVFKVVHKSAKIRGFGGEYQNVLLNTTKNMEELLEYLESLENAAVWLNGSYKTLQNILERVSVDWFPKNSVSLIVSDTLFYASLNERRNWIQQMLRIVAIYHKYFSGKTYDLHWRGSSHDFSLSSENSNYPYFVVDCDAMCLTGYDIHRYLMFEGRGNIALSKKYDDDWQLALKIVREEADSYQETENRVDFVVNGESKSFILCPEEQ